MTPFNKTYTDRNKPFSGWYYDDEQNVFNTSRLVTISLHANSVPVHASESRQLTAEDEKTNKTYVYTKVQSKFKWYHHNNSDLRKGAALLRYPYGRLDRDDSAELNKNIVGEDVSGYFIEPLCTCFAAEDFNITVSNNYQQAGGDVIEQAWNQVKPFAPHVKKLVKMSDEAYKEIKDQAEKSRESGGFLMSTLTGWMEQGADAILKFADDKVGGLRNLAGTVESYLNKSLILNGARFSYYGGTNLAFNNLGMKFTIFPKWYINSKGQAVLKSVTSQVADILPYVVGQYSDWAVPGKLNPMFDGVLGWNTPPGDFRANSSDVDIIQKGTLKLKIGTQYSLTNLVIESAQFNFSKQMMKNPAARYDYKGDQATFGFDQVESLSAGDSGTNQSAGAISPLYCEVTLQLRPITKYTSQMLDRFVNGVYNRYDSDVVYKNFNRNLNEGRKDMEERYKTDQLTNKLGD